MKRFARGFTLLEVMIALAILAVSLSAIVQINGTSIRAHDYAKRVTVATMLARSKMADLESQFNEEGFTSQFDQKMEGDFSEEGWEDFRWEAEIIKPELDAATATTMVQQMVDQFMGQAEDKSGQLANGGPTTDMGAAAGQIAPMIQGQVAQLTETLGKSVREVRLKVYWTEGKETESVDVATHFVILQPADGAVPVPPPGTLPPGGP